MAIDMSKVKGESSTEFGKSLLAETQASNARINKANNKANQRSALIKVGLGAADMFVAKQADALLMNEQNTKNTIQTKLAWQNSQEIAATEAKAQAYTGGYDAYWINEAAGRARADMQKQYGGSATHDPVQYEQLVATRAAAFSEYTKVNHLERLKANKTYLASGGGEGAYLKALKLTTPRTVMGKITNYIGEKAGLTADAEIAQNAKNILTSATELNTFQSIYNDTKNASISLIFAQELGKESEEYKNLKLPDKLKAAPHKFSALKTIDAVDPLTGEKVQHLVSVATAQDGSGTSVIINHTLGNKQVSSGNDYKQSQIFAAQVSVAMQDKKVLTLGASALEYLSVEKRKEINDSINERLSSGFRNPKLRAEQLQNYTDSLNARAGIMTRIAQNSMGLSIDKAQQLAAEVIMLDPTSQGKGGSKQGIGPSNAYHTLQAMSNMEAANSGNFNSEQVARVIGRGGENLIQSYVYGTEDDRIAFTAMIPTLDLKKGALEAIKNIHQTAIKIKALDKNLYSSIQEAVDIVRTKNSLNLSTANDVAGGASSQAPEEKKPDVLTFDSTKTYSTDEIAELTGGRSNAINLNNNLKYLYEMQKADPTNKRIGTAIGIAQQEFEKAYKASKAPQGNPKVLKEQEERKRLRKEKREAAKVKLQTDFKNRKDENILSSYE